MASANLYGSIAYSFSSGETFKIKPQDFMWTFFPRALFLLSFYVHARQTRESDFSDGQITYDRRPIHRYTCEARSREERLNRLLYYHLFTVMIISNRKPSKSKKYLKKADTLNHVVDTAGDTVMVSNLKWRNYNGLQSWVLDAMTSIELKRKLHSLVL